MKILIALIDQSRKADDYRNALLRCGLEENINFQIRYYDQTDHCYEDLFGEVNESGRQIVIVDSGDGISARRLVRKLHDAGKHKDSFFISDQDPEFERDQDDSPFHFNIQYCPLLEDRCKTITNTILGCMKL